MFSVGRSKGRTLPGASKIQSNGKRPGLEEPAKPIKVQRDPDTQPAIAQAITVKPQKYLLLLAMRLGRRGYALGMTPPDSERLFAQIYSRFGCALPLAVLSNRLPYSLHPSIHQIDQSRTATQQVQGLYAGVERPNCCISVMHIAAYQSIPYTELRAE